MKMDKFENTIILRCIEPGEWWTSCDFCESQEEGGHYCLLHGIFVKNMDRKRCNDWKEDSIGC